MKTVLMFIVMTVLFGGCAMHSRNTIIKYHMIPVEMQQARSPENRGSVSLDIKSLAINGMYGTKRMWYRKGTEFTAFAYNQWAVSPAETFSSHALAGLIDSGRFGSVTFASSARKADRTLEIDVADFYQEFQENGSWAIARISINVIANNDRHLIRSDHFDYRVPCRSNDPVGGVEAFEEVLKLFSKDVASSVSAD